MERKIQQKGFAQIPLIITIIFAAILISGSFLYGQGKLDPLLASISQIFQKGEIDKQRSEENYQQETEGGKLKQDFETPTPTPSSSPQPQQTPGTTPTPTPEPKHIMQPTRNPNPTPTSTSVQNSTPIPISTPICKGIDTSCGIDVCNDCTKLPTWVAAEDTYSSCDTVTSSISEYKTMELRKYSCKANKCEYEVTARQGSKLSSKNCSDCSCTCGRYGIEEKLANLNCGDQVDNDCNGLKDSNEPGCEPLIGYVKTFPDKTYVRFEWTTSLLSVDDMYINWQQIKIDGGEVRPIGSSESRYIEDPDVRYHIVTIDGLKTKTDYKYLITARVGNFTASAKGSFRTQ